MLIDRYAPEDVFARVPELAGQTDPVLVHLDRLLDDDQLYQQVRGDLARRYRLTPAHGRHSTPAEVLMRLLVVQHLYAWSYAETVERVGDSLVLRWFCRVYFHHVPVATTLLRWAATIQPATLHALNDRVVALAKQARGRGGANCGWTAPVCRRRSIIRPTVGCWSMACACSRDSCARPDRWSPRHSRACATPSVRDCARYDARRSGCIACDDGLCRLPPKPSSSAFCIRRCCGRRSGL